MDVEAFTMAKDPKDAARNEDRYLIVPGRAYAVIDGSSDKTGLRHKGRTGGQAASAAVEDVIREVCEIDHPERIEAGWLSDRFRERFEILHEEIRASNGTDAPAAMWSGAQLALALQGPESIRFIVVGDSGVRLNGREIFQFHQPLDDICASIRKAVWNHLDVQGVPSEDKNTIARAYTIGGLAEVLPQWTRWIDEDDLPTLRRMAGEHATRLQADLDRGVLEKAVLGGLREQYLYINRIHPLGAPSINGFPIPRDYIMQVDRDLEEIETIELFTDGYFGCPDGTTIADWEDRIARIESTDPEKIGDHASTKGSANGHFADDRTVLILRREPRTLQRSLS